MAQKQPSPSPNTRRPPPPPKPPTKELQQIFFCPRCKGRMRMQVNQVISAPSDLYHNLTRMNMRRKDVYSMATLWETADHLCINEQCGYFLPSVNRQNRVNLRKKK